MKDHLFVANDGDLFDTRVANWAQHPLRKGYQRGCPEIRTVAEFKATLRAGCYAWPGGYPIYLICQDGAALCFDCGRRDARHIMSAIVGKEQFGWRVVACDINYEDSDLICDGCGAPIECAYG